jgi:hypothetical protein
LRKISRWRSKGQKPYRFKAQLHQAVIPALWRANDKIQPQAPSCGFWLYNVLVGKNKHKGLTDFLSGSSVPCEAENIHGRKMYV